MRKRTGTKQERSDDRTTNLSRLIMVDNLRIDSLFVWLRCVTKMCGGKTSVNPKCGLRVVECVANRHDPHTVLSNREAGRGAEGRRM